MDVVIRQGCRHPRSASRSAPDLSLCGDRLQQWARSPCLSLPRHQRPAPQSGQAFHHAADIGPLIVEQRTPSIVLPFHPCGSRERRRAQRLPGHPSTTRDQAAMTFSRLCCPRICSAAAGTLSSRPAPDQFVAARLIPQQLRLLLNRMRRQKYLRATSTRGSRHEHRQSSGVCSRKCAPWQPVAGHIGIASRCLR